jgi:hypothetical protein
MIDAANDAMLSNMSNMSGFCRCIKCMDKIQIFREYLDDPDRIASRMCYDSRQAERKAAAGDPKPKPNPKPDPDPKP